MQEEQSKYAPTMQTVMHHPCADPQLCGHTGVLFGSEGGLMDQLYLIECCLVLDVNNRCLNIFMSAICDGSESLTVLDRLWPKL